MSTPQDLCKQIGIYSPPSPPPPPDEPDKPIDIDRSQPIRDAQHAIKLLGGNPTPRTLPKTTPPAARATSTITAADLRAFYADPSWKEKLAAVEKARKAKEIQKASIEPEQPQSEALRLLYAGIKEYRAKYLEEVKLFIKDNSWVTKGLLEELEIDKDKIDKDEKYAIEKLGFKFFQKLFIYRADREGRTTVTKGETSLKAFFGKEDTALFKKALKEEVNSYKFRNAVLRKSTIHRKEQRPEKLDGLMIIGPSASGKTAGTNAALDTLYQHLPEDPNGVGFDVVCVDGSIIRDSQMQKLAIRTANKHGFTLITDLYKQTDDLLTSIKKKFQAAIFATPTLGVAIPTTCSDLRTSLKRKLPVQFPAHLSPVLVEVTGLVQITPGLRTEQENSTSQHLDLDELQPIRDWMKSIFKVNAGHFRGVVYAQGNYRAKVTNEADLGPTIWYNDLNAETTESKKVWRRVEFLIWLSRIKNGQSHL